MMEWFDSGLLPKVYSSLIIFKPRYKSIQEYFYNVSIDDSLIRVYFIPDTTNKRHVLLGFHFVFKELIDQSSKLLSG